MKICIDPKIGLIRQLAEALPKDHALRKNALKLPEIQDEFLYRLLESFNVKSNGLHDNWGEARDVMVACLPETRTRLGQLLKKQNPRTYCVCGFCGVVSINVRSHKEHLFDTHRIRLDAASDQNRTVKDLIDRRFQNVDEERLRF